MSLPLRERSRQHRSHAGAGATGLPTYAGSAYTAATHLVGSNVGALSSRLFLVPT